ncbi:MAG: phosphoesterase [Mariniblastus sp.]|nr:phosphoesterase [Mariniblastus sp.]
MSTVQAEQVMVVKTDLFHSCGYFQGFSAETEKYLSTLFNPANTQYLPRGEMEEDPGYKQLIPYCIFQYTDANDEVHVFQYTRGKGGGEARLRAKKSVGIGGHISTLDSNDDSPYDEGMRRELEEEIDIACQYDQELVGLINDDQNDVGKVHLGIVHVFRVQEPNVTAREMVISDAGFRPVHELMSDLDSYETWSQICLKALFG